MTKSELPLGFEEACVFIKIKAEYIYYIPIPISLF